MRGGCRWSATEKARGWPVVALSRRSGCGQAGLRSSEAPRAATPASADAAEAAEDGEEVTRVSARATRSPGPACAVRLPGAPWPSAVTGGMRLALAMSLRARGLRGLDVLRRSQDRAPP